MRVLLLMYLLGVHILVLLCDRSKMMETLGTGFGVCT